MIVRQCDNDTAGAHDCRLTCAHTLTRTRNHWQEYRQRYSLVYLLHMRALSHTHSDALTHACTQEDTCTHARTHARTHEEGKEGGRERERESQTLYGNSRKTITTTCFETSRPYAHTNAVAQCHTHRHTFAPQRDRYYCHRHE